MKVQTSGSQQCPPFAACLAHHLPPFALQAAQVAPHATRLLQLRQFGHDPRGPLWIAADVPDTLPSLAAETQLENKMLAAPFR